MANHITLLGRLTKDPEIRQTPSGKTVAQFTLAVDRPFKNEAGQKEADFIPVVVWGKTAELVGNSCQKGHRLLVEGRLQIRSYDGKDGNRHWVTEVIANNVEFVERKADSANRHIEPAGDMGAAPRAGAAKSDMSGLGTSVPFDEDVAF